MCDKNNTNGKWRDHKNKDRRELELCSVVLVCECVCVMMSWVLVLFLFPVYCIYKPSLQPLQPAHLSLSSSHICSALGDGCVFFQIEPPPQRNIVCKLKDTAVSNSAAAAANSPRHTFIWHGADRITVELNETIYQSLRRGSNLVGHTLICTSALVGVWVCSDKGGG